MKQNKSGEWLKLKTLLFEKKVTYIDAAKAINMSYTSFANKINGKQSFRVDEIVNICNEFDLDPYIVLSEKLQNATY